MPCGIHLMVIPHEMLMTTIRKMYSKIIYVAGSCRNNQHIRKFHWVYFRIYNGFGHEKQKHISKHNTIHYKHNYIYQRIHPTIIHSLIILFIHDTIRSFTSLFIHSSHYSFIPLFIHSSTHPTIHSFIHSFITPFIHRTIHSSHYAFIHSLTHPLTHSLTHSFITHSFTHTFTHLFNIRYM